MSLLILYSVFELTALSNLSNNSTFISGFHHQIMSGQLMRREKPKPRSMAHVSLFLNVISALEGTL